MPSPLHDLYGRLNSDLRDFRASLGRMPSPEELEDFSDEALAIVARRFDDPAALSTAIENLQRTAQELEGADTSWLIAGASILEAADHALKLSPTYGVTSRTVKLGDLIKDGLQGKDAEAVDKATKLIANLLPKAYAEAIGGFVKDGFKAGSAAFDIRAAVDASANAFVAGDIADLLRQHVADKLSILERRREQVEAFQSALDGELRSRGSSLAEVLASAPSVEAVRFEGLAEIDFTSYLGSLEQHLQGLERNVAMSP